MLDVKDYHRHRLTDYARLNNMEQTKPTEHSKRFFKHKAYEHVQGVVKNEMGTNERK